MIVEWNPLMTSSTAGLQAAPRQSTIRALLGPAPWRRRSRISFRARLFSRARLAGGRSRPVFFRFHLACVPARLADGLLRIGDGPLAIEVRQFCFAVLQFRIGVRRA